MATPAVGGGGRDENDSGEGGSSGVGWNRTVLDAVRPDTRTGSGDDGNGGDDGGMAVTTAVSL